MNNPKVKTVLAATIDDAADIAAIEAVCFSIPYDRETVEELLTPTYRPSFICRDCSGKMLGYLIGQSLMGEGDLLRIAVTPDARRSGVARKLIEAFIKKLQEDGCHVCFLDVREHNLAAQALYQSFGFQFFDRRHHYYHKPTDDALIMRLSITSL